MHRMQLRNVLGGLLVLGLLLPSATARAERVKINAKRLTVRAGPGTKHKRLGSAPKGRIYEVKERKGSWVAIGFGARKGWVFARYVRTVTDSEPAAGKTASSSAATHTVRATRLNVRSKASVKGKLRFRLRRGARVTVKETQRTWRRIEHRGRTGWVLGKYLVTGKLPPPRPRARKPRRRKQR